jgi:hypothetical protein
MLLVQNYKEYARKIPEIAAAVGWRKERGD